MKKIYEKQLGLQLYQDDEDYYLSILTGSYTLRTIEIKLTEEEKTYFLKSGRLFIDQLAGDITRFPANYTSRQLPNEHPFYQTF